MSEGWYPERPYDWLVRQEGDGSSSLLLALYPFQYNALSTGVKFYQDYAFGIGYTVSAVAITHLSTERTSFEAGEAVRVGIGICASDAPLDAYLEASVHTLAGDYVEGLLIQAMPGLAGPTTFAPVWNSAGKPAGIYTVRARLLNALGDTQDESTCSFRLGTEAAEVVQVTASPAEIDCGGSTNISVQARNTGTVPLEGTLTTEVWRDDQMVSYEEKPFGALMAGQTIAGTMTWSSACHAPGTYHATGTVRYESAAHSQRAEITVRGAGKLLLPLLIKRW